MSAQPPQFACRPKGNDGWARNPANVAAIRDGRILEVMPETVEYAPTADCQFRCRECPYRTSKTSHRPLDPHSFAKSDDKRTSSLDLARLVIDRGLEDGVNASGLLLTGGGNPASVEDFPAILRYAGQRGLITAFYDNGTPFGAHDGLADAVIQPEHNLAFGRFSINFVSPEVGRRFAGVGSEAIDLQALGVANFLQARQRQLARFRKVRREPPACVVSLICDETNVKDVEATCRHIAELFADLARYRGPHDDFVVRPLTRHGRAAYTCEDHGPEVINQLLGVVGKHGTARPILERAGLAVKLGFVLGLVDQGVYATYGTALAAEYATRDRCWTNGLFLTVGPDATVYFCCDRNLDARWAIGNLQTNTVRQIYASDARRALFATVHAGRCGPAGCEATCRTCRLNQIARGIISGDISREHIEDAARRAQLDPWPLLS